MKCPSCGEEGALVVGSLSLKWPPLPVWVSCKCGYVSQLTEQAEMPPPNSGIAGTDIEAAFNMRAWLQSALEAKGAKIVGGGIGCGGGDLDITLEGCKFNVVIRPIQHNVIGPVGFTNDYWKE